MKTDIEKLLRDQRRALDVEEAPEGAWEDIRAFYLSQHKTKSASGFRWWRVAALVFLTSSLGLLTYTYFLRQEVNELASLGDISPSYRDMEQSYLSEIDQMINKISLDKRLSNEEEAEMLQELQMLDKVNEQYRRDIGTDADQELIIEALIDYYEKKIRLLKKIELEINRQENEKRNTITHRAS